MSKKCSIFPALDKVYNSLRAKVGGNETMAINMFFKIHDDNTGEITKDFKDFYATTTGEEYTDKVDANKAANAIRDYYLVKNHKKTNFQRSKRNVEVATYFGYAKTTDREEGKRHIANIVLKTFMDKQNDPNFDHSFNAYKTRIKQTWVDNILNYALNVLKVNKSKSDLRKEFNDAKDRSSYIDDILGGKDKSDVAKNLYAVYRELFSESRREEEGEENVTDVANTVNEYINEVLTDARLGSVRRKLNNETRSSAETEPTEQASELNDIANGEDTAFTEADDDRDGMVEQANSHGGHYTDFMKHLTERLANYFNTLPKITDAKDDTSYYTDNAYGIGETMDAVACTIAILNKGPFANKQQLIDAVNAVSTTIPGYESFSIFAEALKADDDFAMECMTVFGKIRAEKSQLFISDGNPELRNSNRRSNPKNQFLFEIMNQSRNSLGLDHSTNIQDAVKLKEEVDGELNSLFKDHYNNRDMSSDDVKEARKAEIEKRLKVLQGKAAALFRRYFPDVPPTSIAAYIKFRDNGIVEGFKKQRYNITSIIDDVIALAKESQDSVLQARRLTDEIIAAENHNEELKVESKKRLIGPSEWISVDSLRKQEILTENHINKIRSVADAMYVYVDVKTTMNSVNGERNQSSDIINNNFILRLNDTFSATDTSVLLDYGMKVFHTPQARYNPLLSTHTGLNEGVFTEENGEVQLNKGAGWLRFSLFDGSTNEDNGQSAVYAKMNSGDYGPTAIRSFFSGDDPSRASYFMRIPSDAPKTYMIHAPRYATDSLYQVDATDLKTKLDGIIDAIPQFSSQQLLDIFTQQKFTEVTEEKIASDIYKGGDDWIRDLQTVARVNGEEIDAKHPLKNGDDIFVLYAVKSGDEGFLYVKQGKYQKVGNGNMLIGGKVVSVTSNNIDKVDSKLQLTTSIRQKLDAYYTDALRRGQVTINGITIDKVKTTVNRDSQIYKILYNIRKQEILDAANAMDSILELSDSGELLMKGDELPFKQGVDIDAAMQYYHINDGVFAKKDSDGNWHLTGNIFTKSKFTLYNPATNKDANYMEGSGLDTISKTNDESKLNFFYGGVNQGIRIIRNDQRKVHDIELTQAQEEATMAALDNWVADFCEMCIREGQRYEPFIGTNAGSNNLINFGVNHFVVYAGMDAMVEGDTNFYKNIQTFFKRTKEDQGSGNPFGLRNYMKDVKGKPTVIEHSYLDDGTFTETYEDKEGNIKTRETSVHDMLVKRGLGDLKLRDGFVGVTVANSTQKTFASLPPLKQVLIDNYEKAGYSKEQATDKADEILYGPIAHKPDGTIEYEADKRTPKRKGGFSDTKVNDAQSYITLEEWIRRVVGRGQGRRYAALINRLLDPEYHLTAEDLNEFVQVQKNFYFDMYYDEMFNVNRPRQIKNAEFVLIPSLIKGTELEEVYNLMKKAGIDQLNTVETSKASNGKVLKLWDNDGNLTKENVTEFEQLAPTYAETYDYNYLYTQQESPQHMNAENKAGVQVVKKVIDNIPEDHHLYPLAQRFLKAFSANIQDSYNDLVRALEIPTDANGNILCDEHGNIVGFNTEVFYDKLKQEMARQGLDNNMLDYVTIPDGEGVPLMPGITPLALSKFESVFQSIFNNAITRQKLPGFHAAQVTAIGTVSTDKKPYKRTNDDYKGPAELSVEEYNALKPEIKNYYQDSRVGYSKELRYHPNKQGYIEIKVSASVYDFKSIKGRRFRNNQERLDAMLKELQEAGLDEIIGYRIPTEGKQSVCNMKIVGLLDEAYGSTIVVPNEWVAQTGSDFDIDSVYTIQYEHYYDKENKLRKVEYREKEVLGKSDYIKYVKEKVKAARGIKSSPKIKAAIESLHRDFNDEFIELSKKETESYTKANDIGIEQDVFEQIIGRKAKDKNDKVISNPTVKEFLQAIYADERKYAKRYDLNKRDAYIHQLDTLCTQLDSLLTEIEDSLDDDDYTALSDLYDANYNIHENLDNYDYNFESAKENEIEKIELEDFENIEAKAKAAGIADYKTWSSFTEESKNTRKARNNRILDSMWRILNDPSSLEENLSRSNFDDITRVLNADYLPNEFKDERNARTAYNIFDQIKFQEDAMSGATLKGISVALDGFCSICNRVQANIADNHQITVTYNKADVDNVKMLKERFNVIAETPDTITIRHDTYGWSKKGNRNVVGKLLTPYSSQTTAYILDAIKEGAIPNVNIYTFSTYKTLLNMGMDFKTAIVFMMQPGVSDIVRYYTENKSIFSDEVGNPIHKAIRNIAMELGLNVNSRTSIANTLGILNSAIGKDFAKMFGGKIALNQEDTKNIPLLVDKLVDRLNNQGDFSSPVGENVGRTKEQLLFDLGTILLFNKIRNTANETTSIAQCCNPDKFGAKATVYETRKIFEDIYGLIWSSSSTEENKVERDPVLTAKDYNGDEVNILKAIYPGVEGGIINVLNNMKPENSRYQSLATFLKCSTAFSIACASNVLITQRQDFVNAVDGLATCFTGTNPTLTKEEYNKFEKWLLAYFWNNSLSIASPIIYRKDKFGNLERVPDHKGSLEAERRRVFGLASQASLRLHKVEKETYTSEIDGEEKTDERDIYYEVKIKDINNPTDEEIAEFSKYSPAQKVSWIKKHFEDAGVFNLFSVNLNNVGRMSSSSGIQTITYKSDAVSPNVALELFAAAYNDENPLITLTAIDIIKYAVMVDGYRMSKTGVAKTVDNGSIYTAIIDGGMGIVDDVVDQINLVNFYFKDPNISRNIYEMYLRSEKNNNIRTLNLTEENRSKYNIESLEHGIYYVGFGDNTKESNELLADMGILSEYSTSKYQYKKNKYIYLKNRRGEINLYYIHHGAFGIYMYPLNKLMPNEMTEESINSDKEYHRFPSRQGLELFIESIEDIKKENYKETIYDIASNMDDFDMSQYRTSVSRLRRERGAKEFDWNDSDAKQGIVEARDKVINHFSTEYGDYYFMNNALNSYIENKGLQNGSPQEATINGIKRNFIVYKQDLTSGAKRFLKGNNPSMKGVKENDSLRKTLIDMKNSGYTEATHLFVASEVNLENPFNDESMESSAGVLEDNLIRDVKYLKTRKVSGIDPDASDVISAFKRHGITSEDASIFNNKEIIVRETARYAIKASERIRHKFTHFTQTPEGEWLKMSDDRVQKLLLKNKVLCNEYLRTLNEAHAFLNVFENWKRSDIQTDSDEMRTFVNTIIKAYDALNSSEILPLIDAAEKKFAEQYVKTLTNNPTIKEGLVSMLIGMHKTYGTMWRFHDVAENGTPLLQTILKEAIGNIEARRLQTEEDKRKFRKELAAIIDEATKAGVVVDKSKIIKDGKWTQNCKAEFINTYESLVSSMQDARKVYGEGSVEHLQAKLLLDTFKAQYINQPAKPEYYLTQAEYDGDMLDRHPKVFSAYKKLLYQAQGLYGFMSDTGLNEDHQAELEALYADMKNLYRGETYMNSEGDIVKRKKLADCKTDEEKLYSIESADALADYINASAELDDEYREKKPIAGFDILLEQNLKIVQDYEERDGNGVPRHSQAYLMGIPEYRKAKEWLNNNAQFAIDYNKLATELPEMFGGEVPAGAKVGAYVTKLLKSVGRHGKGRFSTFNRLANTYKIHDEYGIPDANKLGKTIEEINDNIKKIKESQEYNFNKQMYPEFSDMTLISSSGNTSTDIYNDAFYSGLSVNKAKSERYVQIVTEINGLTRQFYNPKDGTIHFELVPDTEQGIELLKQLARLYSELDEIKKYNGEVPHRVGEFIEEHVEFVPNNTAYQAQFNAAHEGKSREWYEWWIMCNCELDENGVPIEMRDNEGNVVTDIYGAPAYKPSRHIYGYMKPKGKRGDSHYDMFVDKKRTEANYMLPNFFVKTKTQYYKDTQAKAQTDPKSLGFDSYEAWYDANHIYNPYTHTVEPVECWLQSSYNDTIIGERYRFGKWLPKGSMFRKSVRDGYDEDGTYDVANDKTNKDYVEHGSAIQNYRVGANDGFFDNPIQLNEYEKKYRDRMQKELYRFALTEKSRAFLDKGFIPTSLAHDKYGWKKLGRDVGTMLGVDLRLQDKKDKPFKNNIDWESDYIPDIPMTSMLQSKEVVTLQEGETPDKYPGQTVRYDEPRPQRSDFPDTNEGRLQWIEAIDKWTKLYNDVNKHNEEVHSSLLTDTDWVDNICNFMTYASTIQGFQENKEILYYLLRAIENMDMVERRYKVTGDLAIDEERSEKKEDGNKVYATSRDKELYEQLANYIRRLGYNQFQENTGPYVRAANILQNFTSANYMMLNYRGGIANVTYGESQILAEAAAKEHFGIKDWTFGIKEYGKGCISYVANMYDETSTTKQDAIIKYCCIIDYDDVNGVVRTVDYETYAERLRNLMFHPQSAGEHFMQNSVLFAMLHSHKLVPITDDPTGIGTMYMNLAEYKRYKLAETLVNEVFDAEQIKKFNEEKKRISEDLNEAKDYAWFRKDILHNFVYEHCNKEQQDKFLKAEKDLSKQFTDEFESFEDMYSQLALGKDGKLEFKEGSQLDELNQKLDAMGISYANNIMGRFINRARSVNNKIHGVYNRKGAAWLEKTWYGRLIMQYHKHIPIGLLKRYRVRGLFNETRGTVEKGMYTTLYDFLTMPVDKIKKEQNLTQAQGDVLKAMQNMFTYITHYLGELVTAWKFLPDYERANIRRLLNNTGFLLGTAALMIALSAMGGGDDDDDLAYNLAIYEVDRWSSELFYYFPIGMMAETKKLSSTPIAAQSIVNDAFKTMTELSSLMLYGEDSSVYQSGRWAGRSKFRVFLERRIPGWAGVKAILDTPTNNHYFKYQQNFLGFIDAEKRGEEIRKAFK